MCTCINFKTECGYFGRTLDLEHRFGEKVAVTPRNFEIKLKNGEKLNTSYAIIGMAAVMENYPLYAEAANEKGLAMAGLNFPQNACFFKPEKEKLNLTPYELILYFLAKYATVKELREDLKVLNITDVPFANGVPISELHWMISDKAECIVLEQTRGGLQVYDNPIGVLTNNPPFDYHLNNINNYIGLTPDCPKNSFSQSVDLKHYGRGMGAIGLPGDTSPASRFVRAAFNKLNSRCESDEISSVTQFFHILDSVSLVSGATLTENGECDITQYSCCINLDKGIYYYKTYANNQITAVELCENNKTGKSLSIYELCEKQNISYQK